MMPGKCSIVIATHGGDEWRKLAEQRALPSAMNQNECEIIILHMPEGKIHEARNKGAAHAEGEWLCFLDADDELEPGYIDAMLEGKGDLRYPRVRYVPPGLIGPLPEPVTLQKKNLFEGNYMVIGTMMRRELFNQVGGFDEFESWEDWALYIKCWIAGAKSKLIEKAIYRCYQNPAGRCVTFNGLTGQELHNKIANCYRPKALAAGLI